MHRIKTVDIVRIALFAVIIAVCSWISIPTPIPFTLQTLGVCLAACFLGGKKATLSVLIYLLLGIVGVPVFAGFTGGIGVVLGLNGGYLVGFLLIPIAAWIAELLPQSKWRAPLSMTAGLILCYAIGTAWFCYVSKSSEIGIWSALTTCVLPYIVPDGIKIWLAIYLSKRVKSVRN